MKAPAFKGLPQSPMLVRRRRLAMKMKLLGVAAAVVVLASPANAANLIANGSFETTVPAVAAGSFQTYLSGDTTGLPGWTVTGPIGTGVSAVSGTFSQNGVTFNAQSGSVWLEAMAATRRKA